jgi:hypothetical protein
MTDADKPGFVSALAELSLLRPAGLKLTEAHFAAWWNAMRHDWTLAEFQRACANLAQSVEDFTIGPQHFAQLRRAASEQTAGEAWARVLQTVRTMHPREGASIEPRIDAVVRQLGGYGHLAMTNSDEMHFRAKRFAELWVESGDAEEARAALPGLTHQRGPVALRDLTQRLSLKRVEVADAAS